MMNNRLLLVRNIKIKCSFDDSKIIDSQAIQSALKSLKKLRVFNEIVSDSGFIYKKSIDARKRDDIYFVYTVAFAIKDGVSLHEIKGVDILENYDVEKEFVCSAKHSHPPVVIGFGPAGMFCALALAKAGLNPIVIERGADVDNRAAAVERYWNFGILDKNTNVQFGEGGAGTFSDGKLLTRISDNLCNYIMYQLVKFGAPEEIMYLSKPHVGTDNLRNVVKNIRNEIISLGGQVRFLETFVGFKQKDKKASCVVLESGEVIECSAIFMCIGHSARDTVKKIMSHGMVVEPKPFSVGVRIEHLQRDIDESLYGRFAGCESLGKAQYTLSKRVDGRAVYSFCMCPGGIVVASASDDDQIVTNGMSYYARDGKNANSAIAVSIDPADYGSTVDGAIQFQERIERKAFETAGRNGSAPIQLLGDFFNDELKNEPSRIMPTYTGKTVMRRADDVFPSFICEKLRTGIAMFERDIKGFSAHDAVLTFPETRTSSPVKIPRDENYLALGFSNVYPCGEGAGYAGGITSAAVDGLRAALSFLKA